MPPKTVRPSDAASLILMRRSGVETEVLMGRRARGHAFMPHFYVFPGGRLDGTDMRVTPAAPLRREVLERLKPSCAPPKAQALAIAAVRETSEESGLLLGRPGPGPAATPAWGRFADSGLAPALDVLDYAGRAITPASAPIRFHNRFFLAAGRHARGELGGSGELTDLAWRSLADSAALGLADVTEFMLREAARLFAVAPASGAHAPLFSYRHGRARVTYD